MFSGTEILKRNFSSSGRLSVTIQKNFPGYNYFVLSNLVDEFETYPGGFFFRDQDPVRFYKTPEDLMKKLLAQLKNDQDIFKIFVKKQIWTFLAYHLHRFPSQENLLFEFENTLLKIVVSESKSHAVFLLWIVYHCEPVKSLFLKLHYNILNSPERLSFKQGEIYFKSSYSQLTALIEQDKQIQAREKVQKNEIDYNCLNFFEPDHLIFSHGLSFETYNEIFNCLMKSKTPFLLFPKVKDMIGDMMLLDSKEILEFIPENSGKLRLLTNKLNKISYLNKEGYSVRPFFIDSSRVRESLSSLVFLTKQVALCNEEEEPGFGEFGGIEDEAMKQSMINFCCLVHTQYVFTTNQAEILNYLEAAQQEALDPTIPYKKMIVSTMLQCIAEMDYNEAIQVVGALEQNSMVDVVEAGFVSAVDVSEFQKFVSNTPLTDEEERIWAYVDDLQKMMQQQMQDHQEESHGVRGGDYGVHETSPVSDIPLFLGILLSAFVVLLCLIVRNTKPTTTKTAEPEAKKPSSDEKEKKEAEKKNN